MKTTFKKELSISICTKCGTVQQSMPWKCGLLFENLYKHTIKIEINAGPCLLCYHTTRTHKLGPYDWFLLVKKHVKTHLTQPLRSMAETLSNERVVLYLYHAWRGLYFTIKRRCSIHENVFGFFFLQNLQLHLGWIKRFYKRFHRNPNVKIIHRLPKLPLVPSGR